MKGIKKWGLKTQFAGGEMKLNHLAEGQSNKTEHSHEERQFLEQMTSGIQWLRDIFYECKRNGTRN